MRIILREGGNVFKDANVGKIKKENIYSTIDKFVEELGNIFPKAREEIAKNEPLGSVGKKPESGDIDLSMDVSAFFDENGTPRFDIWEVDPNAHKELVQKITAKARTASPKQTALRAMLELVADKIEEKTETMSVDKKSATGGSLHFLFPQYKPDGEMLEPPLNAQIDIMVGNQDWLKFSYYSDVYAGNVKGLHRTQLMLATFGAKGYTFVHGSGVKNRETNEVEANTPQQAIELLNSLYGFRITPEIIQNYFKLRPFLEENVSEEEYNKILDTYLKILDSTRADIPEDLQQYWIDNQQRLGLKGKFLPDDSKLVSYKMMQESLSYSRGLKVILGARR